MIDQLNIYGMTKLEVSIQRIKHIEPRGGSWYLAFSGGKDSCVIKALCDMAGVKYDAHYRVNDDGFCNYVERGADEGTTE